MIEKQITEKQPGSAKRFHQSLTDRIISRLKPKKTDRPDSYFEAIIQLRTPCMEIADFMSSQINKRADVFVSEITPLNEGIDIKLSSQRFARSLGAKMKKTFKGELKTSRKLFTLNHQTSKKVYRVTICFRMKKGSTEENSNP